MQVFIYHLLGQCTLLIDIQQWKYIHKDKKKALVCALCRVRQTTVLKKMEPFT
jgi:hypothetical protein